jgi:hypothetical protein
MKIEGMDRSETDPLRRSLHRHFDRMHGQLRHKPSMMQWPSEEQARGSVYIGNRDYRDLRSTTWAEVQDVLVRETKAIEAWEAKGGWPVSWPLIPSVEVWANANGGMDLGVTSATYALAAAGGVPIISCNGGAFGGRHLDNLPCVGLWWKADALEPLLECVEHAGMSTWMDHDGIIVIGGDYIRRFLVLAEALHKRSAAFGRHADIHVS